MNKYSIEELNSMLHQTNAFGEKWTAVDKIGQGRYSEVFRIQRKTGETVEESALKWIYVSARNDDLTEGDQRTNCTILKKKYSHELEIMIRFKGEPSIVRYENYSIKDDEDGLGFSIFLQMELLQSLRQYCVQNSIQIRDVAEIGRQISRACSILEREKLVHGDIKPENIFVTQDGKQYKLGDFGIAASPEAFGVKQKHRGTEGYIAPEVERKGSVDYSCDQYSLGIVLYELLNDREIPNEGKRGEDGRFPKPRYGNAELSSIIIRMCHAERGCRFEDAEAVEEQFRKLLNRSDSFLQQEICEGTVASERETRTDMRSSYVNTDEKDKARTVLPAEMTCETDEENDPKADNSESVDPEEAPSLSKRIFGGTLKGLEVVREREREKRLKTTKISVTALFILILIVGVVFLFQGSALEIQSLTARMNGSQCIIEWIANENAEWEVFLLKEDGHVVDRQTTASKECVFNGVFPGEYIIAVRDSMQETAAQIDFACRFKEVPDRIDTIYLVQYPMKHRESGLGRKYIVSSERQEEVVTYELGKTVAEQPFGYAIKFEHDYLLGGTLCLQSNGGSVCQEWQSEMNGVTVWIDITEMLGQTGKWNKGISKVQLLVYGDGEVYEELEFEVDFQ